MFKIILFSLVLQSLVAFSTQAVVPNCDNSRLDACTGRLLDMIKADTPVPETVAQVEGHCG